MRSYQGEATIREHFEARAPARGADGRSSGGREKRQNQAGSRASQTRAARTTEGALEELQKLQADRPEKAKSKVRVSTSDPQARVMKLSDGGLALSYNAQISADRSARVDRGCSGDDGCQ